MILMVMLTAAAWCTSAGLGVHVGQQALDVALAASIPRAHARDGGLAHDDALMNDTPGFGASDAARVEFQRGLHFFNQVGDASWMRTS